MDEIAAKLTNLGYEIFGVLLPGFVGTLFLLSTWWSLGDIPSELTNGTLPALAVKDVVARELTAVDMGLGGAFIYFVGHLLNWLSRIPGPPSKDAADRIGRSLLFRIPRPAVSFDQELKPMMEATAARFGLPIDGSTWRRFYPIAKVVLAENISRSLVSTYQNKYTFHRSLTAAATLLFWTTCVLLVACSLNTGLPEPRWWALWLSLPAALTLVWGFSDSFAYHWTMWGNVIVTETFALASGLTGKKMTNE